MQKLAILMLTLLCLAGCGSKEEEVVITPPLTEQFNTVTLGPACIDAVGSHCGYVQLSDREIEVHPYYDLPECITVTHMLVSPDNDWWSGVVSDFGDSITVLEYESYTVFTAPNGVTYGYMQLTDDEAVIATTSNLPSSYVKLVMDSIWL